MWLFLLSNDQLYQEWWRLWVFNSIGNFVNVCHRNMGMGPMHPPVTGFLWGFFSSFFTVGTSTQPTSDNRKIALQITLARDAEKPKNRKDSINFLEFEVPKYLQPHWKLASYRSFRTTTDGYMTFIGSLASFLGRKKSSRTSITVRRLN
jgi:hypothetical protein